MPTISFVGCTSAAHCTGWLDEKRSIRRNALFIDALRCVRLTRAENFAEAANRESEQAEANNGDDDAGQQRWPEPDARKEHRKCEEHSQRRDNIPKRVPRMICDFFLGLVFDIQPDKRENGNEGQRRNKATELVAALRKL